MRICRKLFVVVIADNDHGKSTAMNALVAQGMGAASPGRKGSRRLSSPWGREIDAYIFVRSYQETERAKHGTVKAAINHNDPMWRERELIIFPSHVSRSSSDIDEMIEAAHETGFDAVCASLIITGDEGDDTELVAPIWSKNWDIRWTLPNPRTEHWKEQVEAIGRDLWTWICQTLAS